MNEMRVEQSCRPDPQTRRIRHLFQTPVGAANRSANAKLAILDCSGSFASSRYPRRSARLPIAFAREHACCGSCNNPGDPDDGERAGRRILQWRIVTRARFRRSQSFLHVHARCLNGHHGATRPCRACGSEAFIVGREIEIASTNRFSDRNSGVGPCARGWHSNGILGPICCGLFSRKCASPRQGADAGRHRISGRIMRGTHAGWRNNGQAFSDRSSRCHWIDLRIAS